MLRSELKWVKILSEPSIKRQRRCNPLIGGFISVAGAPLFQQRATMSQQKGGGDEAGYEHEHEYHEDELEDESANNAAAVKPMNSVWECKHLCIKMHKDGFGKLISGWTCAYSSRPGNVEGYVFGKSVNATKACSHVLKLAGQDVAICREIIPYEKKMAYKTLYNMNLVKKKEKKARDVALQATGGKIGTSPNLHILRKPRTKHSTCRENT